MSIPSQGHGEVVLMQCGGGYVQLRDELTRFWCAYGHLQLLGLKRSCRSITSNVSNVIIRP